MISFRINMPDHVVSSNIELRYDMIQGFLHKCLKILFLKGASTVKSEIDFF